LIRIGRHRVVTFAGANDGNHQPRHGVSHS